MSTQWKNFEDRKEGKQIQIISSLMEYNSEVRVCHCYCEISAHELILFEYESWRMGKGPYMK